MRERESNSTRNCDFHFPWQVLRLPGFPSRLESEKVTLGCALFLSFLRARDHLVSMAATFMVAYQFTFR